MVHTSDSIAYADKLMKQLDIALTALLLISIGFIIFLNIKPKNVQKIECHEVFISGLGYSVAPELKESFLNSKSNKPCAEWYKNLQSNCISY